MTIFVKEIIRFELQIQEFSARKLGVAALQIL